LHDTLPCCNSCSQWFAVLVCSVSFLSNDVSTTEISPLSLHDALPISEQFDLVGQKKNVEEKFIRSAKKSNQSFFNTTPAARPGRDRKSTRLNSSHEWISYAVFCLKKKTQSQILIQIRT